MTDVPIPAAGERPVGREPELATLARAVQALVGGRGAVVEISGEPGIGKTRLATALAEIAAARGLPLVRAHAVRGNTTALQVFRDAWHRRPAPGGAVEHPGEWAAGCVLILDDLHWSDPDTTALLVRLLRAVVPEPLLLVLVHRPAQSPPGLREALEDGVRAGTVTRIEPGPLTPDTVTALLTQWQLPATADPALLCTAAQGNPRYLRLLAAAGWQPEHWPERPGPDTPALLREAKPLIAELDALTTPATRTASAAAVLGNPFRPQDIAHLTTLDLDTTLDALTELETAHLVHPADWNGGLTFHHPLIGHITHERTSLAFRLRAHRDALDLTTRTPHQRARHATHLLGTDATLAAHTLAEAATETTAHDPTTAAHWLRTALKALPATDPTTRTHLQLAYCRALIASGQLREARTRAHQLLGTPQPPLPQSQLLQAHAVCANAERQLGRYTEAAAITGAALGLLPDPLSREAVELIIEFGLTHVLRGTHDQAQDLLRKTLRAPADADAIDATDRTVLRVLDLLCATHAGDLQEAVDEAVRCAQLVDALPDPLAGRTPETLALLGSAELYLERFTDAARHLSRGIETVDAGPQRPILLHRLLGLAMAEQWTGRLEDSRKHAREAEALARSLGAEPAIALAQAISATTLVWARGTSYAEEAVALVEEVAGTTATSHGWWAASATGLLAHARLLAGDAAGCRRTLLTSGGGERLPRVRPFSRPFLLALLATATLECGDREEAGRLVRIAETEAGRLGLPVQEAYVRCARARLHQADGQHPDAAKHFDLAAEAFRSADMPVEYAWTLTSGARSFHEAHGPATALRRLDTAEAVARAATAGLVLEQAARLRAELPEGDGTPHPLGLLSDREREIAELAATGLRTRQIAERLFLSPRTVETHLSRIYRKLDVTSRLTLSELLRTAG
ncbi:LuxR family transcriptional regulator [Streptomyces sp. SID13726]|uniref:LuxR C-terminal-related transcriptional regulator n=1 Tax=Streptomyces sp. SID13726 TaxID=2706058 RepID=UPI0013B9078E|nr:LuxR family transcriptional regulator [Streptomyces sp. SID13726]NEA97636.1 AAA family ATPase [Streptomyces sp. SID13726]